MKIAGDTFAAVGPDDGDLLIDARWKTRSR